MNDPEMRVLGPDPEVLARFDRVLTLVELLAKGLEKMLYPDHWIIGVQPPHERDVSE